MTNTVQYNFKIDQKSRNNLNKHNSFVIWFTGLSGSGKSTICDGLEELLTYGAFSYPVAFLITDLANRSYGKIVARKIVYVGFTIGIIFTLLFSTNFADLISIRIAIGSGTAFLVAQIIDVQIFDNLRKRTWYIAPLTSSIIGSSVDTFLFFSISFYATGIPWFTLSLGDLAVKIFVALVMLIPFRLLLGTLKAVKV